MAVQQRPGSSEQRLSAGLPERRYRPEIHGIRGLALLGVVVFHLFGNGRVSGGIDIFLAVSGFLFTGMLLREAATSGGQIGLGRYFGRLVRRILVPAAVVVTFTLILGLLISPVTQHSQLWAEARASLLYFENFELINSQLAYGAAGPETSPFQHFWSLSVQGQFYLLWPVIAIIAVLAARALKTSAARVMAFLIGGVIVSSSIYAIYVGGYDQDAAYLMSTTRAWELAFGGFLALIGGSARLPKSLRGAGGWIGIALIVSCGFVLDGGHLFPGPWALWPLLGLTLVLMAAGPQGGENDPVGSATRFLSNRPLAWVGDHAYGLYLWHWPLLIFYLEVRDREAVGIRGALVILAITIVLAVLMYRYIEKPLKDLQAKRSPATSKKANKIVVGLAAGTLILAGTGATTVLNQPQNQLAPVSDDWDWENYPGAMAAADNDIIVPEGHEFLPNVKELPSQRANFYDWGCHQRLGNDPGTDEVTVCEDPNKPKNPKLTITISGGSHAGHWHQAWQELAQEYNWELLVVNKDGCVFRDTSDANTNMCAAWNKNYMKWLDERDVDLVVTNGTRIFSESRERIQTGAPARWNEIIDQGSKLVLMRGTPRPGERVDDCLASGGTPEDCGADTSQIADVNPLHEVALPPGATIIDMLPYVCPQGIANGASDCPAVVGNVVVWYDGSHLTNHFVGTLTPILEVRLRGQVPWLFH